MGLNNITFRKRVKVSIRHKVSSLRPTREGWQDEAKCRGEDLNLFVYPSDYPTDKQRSKLESICNGCPVVLDCRIEGLRTMSDGWWGGMTPDERYRWAAEELFKED